MGRPAGRERGNMNRDTQFAGFAALLAEEIDEQFGAVLRWAEKRGTVDQAEIARELSSRWGTLIARRASDLVTHAIENADYSGIKGWIKGENIPLFHKV